MLKPQIKEDTYLRATSSHTWFPFDQLQEFTPDGESLEVVVPGVAGAQIRGGRHLWTRFADFLPFSKIDPDISLGEGNTPLLRAAPPLRNLTGVENLFLKDETQNPTWSFKDRGTLTSILMTQAKDERTTATISTGNMGHSVAAYAARAGLRAVVFVPHFAPMQKIQSISIHGGLVVRVTAPDYASMKSQILALADEFQLRIVSGNGPIRVEGYKLIAYELFEQLKGKVPDFIAVPTSACGHIRGIWKGWRELYEANLVDRLPRMIIVQAANNSPIVSALKQGLHQIIPFTNFQTIAEAITSGNPLGGDEILAKAYEYDWLGETATEKEILDGQLLLARSGHFVEPATATSIHAIRKLRENGKIDKDETVVIMLTGGGLKDLDVMPLHKLPVSEVNITEINKFLRQTL